MYIHIYIHYNNYFSPVPGMSASLIPECRRLSNNHNNHNTSNNDSNT